MSESNSIKSVHISGLSNQTKIRLHEIKDYFNTEIQESKYIAAFDYIDKTLIVLFATSGRVFIISHASVIGAPAGIASARFTLMSSLTTEIINKVLKIARNKKKNHNKMAILAKSKLNTIETLISQALIDLKISYKKIKTVVKEKEKYEKNKRKY